MGLAKKYRSEDFVKIGYRLRLRLRLSSKDLEV